MFCFAKSLAIVLFLLLAAWSASGLANVYQYRDDLVFAAAAPFIVLGLLVVICSLLVVFLLTRDHPAAIPLGVGICVLIAAFGFWSFLDFRARGGGSRMAFVVNVVIPLLPALPLLLVRRSRRQAGPD